MKLLEDAVQKVVKDLRQLTTNLVKNSYKKPFRISTQKDIVFLLENGKRWKSNIFTVIYHKNSGTQDRFGVLVSKKNGIAVERVRIKRVYREAFVTTPVEPDTFFDILVRPRYGTDHQFHEVKGEYERWRKNAVPANPR